MKLEFTIRDTRYYKITFTDLERSVKIECWIADDYMFMVFDTPEAGAKLLRLEDVKEMGLEKDLLHKDADCVALVKRSVWEIATDEEIEALCAHEAAHFALNHNGASTKETEKAVEAIIGEDTQMIIDLFSVRYVLLKTPYAKINKEMRRQPMFRWN